MTDPLGYGGSHIGNFIAGDNVDLSGSWSLFNFSENGGGTLGTLTLTNGTNQVALEFAGSFSQTSFHIQSGATTVIGHNRKTASLRPLTEVIEGFCTLVSVSDEGFPGLGIVQIVRDGS